MSPIVVVRDIAYEFSDGRELFKHLSFTLSGERSALVGPNGVGKTCLAKLLVGELEPTSGAIQRPGAIKMFAQRQLPAPVTVAEYLASVEQWSLTRDRLLTNIDQQAPCTTLSGGQWTRVRLARALDDGFLILDEPTDDLDRVLDNIRAVAAGTEGEIRTHLARFLFAKDTVFKKAGDLSGGERLRAALARGLLSASKPELLLLDEPTHNLDLTNIEWLESIVREFRGALIVVSHDQQFLDHCGVASELLLR